MKLNQDLLAKAAGFECLDKKCSDRLEAYARLLADANRRINLMSRSVDPEREIESQIAISLLLLRLAPPETATWIDIGSGGGFPVMPLACMRDDIQFTAVEQVAKKAFFLERTAQELRLENLKIVATPIESLIAKSSPMRWNIVSIKAVTDLDQSFAWSYNLLIDKGNLLTYKSDTQISESEKVSLKYGFELTDTVAVKELIDTIDIQVVMYKKS